MRVVAAALVCALAAAAPRVRVRDALARASAALAPVQPAALAGELFYATCALPACETLALSLFDLANASSTNLFDFPLDSFEDGYVADSVLAPGGVVILSLQYDGRPQQGFLLSFNLTSRTILSGFNSSFCFALFLDPSDATGDNLLCLALEPTCDGGSQCSQLRHISRAAQTDTLVSQFMPNAAPYTVSCLDTKRNLIYSTFGGLNTIGPNLIAAITIDTGVVVNNASFPISTAYIELEYDYVTDAVYAVVEDAQDGAFFGTVEPSTGVATPVGTNRFNTSYWNQFNTISTVAPEIGVFFSTAFHYGVPNPPSDPILHLVGNSLTTGEIVFDEVIQNPFCEILWTPAPSAD